MNLYLGHSAADIFLKLKPKMPGLRLRLSIWRPIVVHMFILASELAIITSIALGDIYSKNL